ncbi:MAG: hypothetical protein ACK41E_06400 [Deinococcales bacterium]
MVLIRLVLAFVILSATAQAAEYKAQHGWGLPTRQATSSITQGVVFDLAQKRIIVAESTGLESIDQNGQKALLLEQSGIRNLVGLGSGKNLVLAWYQRNITGESGVWWWYNNRARFAFATPYSNFSLVLEDNKPLLIAAIQNRALTELKLQRWGQPAKIIYQTEQNIGALSANALGKRIAMIFARGYRNERDEKYDLMLLEIGKPIRQIAPAVYLGKEQQYLMAVLDQDFVPIWWYETPQEQKVAAFTKQHFPRLALLEGEKIVEFAPPEKLLGQAETRVYYANKNRVSSIDLKSKETRLELISSDTLTTAHLSGQNLVWQSLNQDGFSSQLWFVDKSQPFTPDLLDHISAALGWNPWHPWQNFFGQVMLSFIFAVAVVLVIVPSVWLLRHRFDFGRGAWFGLTVAWLVLLGGRIFGGNLGLGDWVFAPLFAPAWWVVGLGLALGSIAVFCNRKKLDGTELGATIACSLAVFISVFVMMFSRVGFLRF